MLEFKVAKQTKKLSNNMTPALSLYTLTELQNYSYFNYDILLQKTINLINQRH